VKSRNPLPVSAVPSSGPLPPNRRVRPKAQRQPFVEASDGANGSAESAAPRANDSWAPPGDAGSSRRAWEGLRAAASIIATMATALACVWGLVRYTRTSPRFAVRSVEAHGAIHRSSVDLARLAGISQGQNIFAVDLETARVRILADPWIEQVTVARRLPGSVVLDVVEREASALVAIGAELYVVTRAGEPFKRLEPSDPYDLPIVTGVRADDVAKDRTGMVAAIKRGLDLMAEYERSNAAKTLPVQEVNLSDDGGMSLTVGKEPVVIRFGKGPYRQPIEEASRVLAEVATRRAQPAVVFVDNEAHPERVVVRMR
jgi:cell division protein FtsQ